MALFYSFKAAIDLANNFKILCKNPTDVNTQNLIVDALYEINKDKIEPLIKSIVLPLLVIKPLDEKVRNAVFSCCKRVISRSSLTTEFSSKDLYDAALNILQQNPEQISLKQYALEVGRWHYALNRPNGKVTIYDEQSIQNDILVRSK